MRRTNKYCRLRRRHGSARVTSFSGGFEWRRSSGEERLPDAEIEKRLESEICFDPDIWIVEVENPGGQNLLKELSWTKSRKGEKSMKLYTAPTSPFGRKAGIVAREHGIDLEEEICNPFESEELAGLNPLRFIPVLVLDDGAVLHDSQLICEYLDSIGAGPTLYPEAGRWLWRTRMMLGHGLAEASVQLRLQQVLPAKERSSTMMARYRVRVSRAVARLESQVDALIPGAPRMDKICAVIGLGHVEFRHGEAWRGDAPNLAAWYDEAMQRPSFAETAPK